MISVSLLASAVLVGCGGGGADAIAAQSLSGSAVKGPISDANITLWDANRTLIASTLSTGGTFSFPTMALDSDYYVLESKGGWYTDEATKANVTMTDAQGLSTLVSKAELQSMFSTGTYAALTPETTIYTQLVENLLDDNVTLSDVQTQVKDLITKVMIEGTSPLSVLPGDAFLMQGDLTSPFPKNQTEAFARNRSISMSYMTRDLGLAAERVFDLITAIVEDLKDGTSDGISIDAQLDLNVTEEFGLARAKLFQDTTTKLRNGELSDAQKEELRLMGFDVDAFAGSLADDQAILDAEVATYLASDTLPTLHVLDTLIDEDGNNTDG